MQLSIYIRVATRAAVSLHQHRGLTIVDTFVLEINVISLVNKNDLLSIVIMVV